jgi:hypothetical protein
MLGKPDFEVKMLVDPGETLNDDEPRKRVRNEFRIEKSTKAVMLFLDSGDRTLFDAGWIARLRAFEDEDDLQVTYKKRFGIGGDSEDAVDDAVRQARNDGFADAPEEYDAQVEWGLDELTLTASLKAGGGPRDTSELRLPDGETARQLAVVIMPSVLEQQLPEARAILETAHLYGPVFGERWIGEWHDDELFVEVWNVRRSSDTDETEPIVEVSLKKKRHESAENRHGDLKKLLKKKDWLAGEQRSKTEIILERY